MIGAGVIKGMLLTFREFVGTYPAGQWLLRTLHLRSGHGLVTIQYPETKQQHPERFRYFPFLIYDGTAENLRCVSCKICEQECPPQCIFIEQAKDEQNRPLRANGRPYPKTFNIDTAICMSCRICVDVCPFDAIEMDNQFEYASRDRYESMVFNKEALLKSAEYFQKIKPTEASVVDQRLAAKTKKAAPAPAATVPSTGTPPTPLTPQPQ